MNERAIAAFAVAPLVVPAFIAPLYAADLSPQWIMIVFMLAAICSYVATALLGIPLYLMLRDWQWTQIWVAVPAGFFAGCMAWAIFMALSGGNFPPESIAWPGGTMGATYGLVFWLIARPDIKAPASAATRA